MLLKTFYFVKAVLASMIHINVAYNVMQNIIGLLLFHNYLDLQIVIHLGYTQQMVCLPFRFKSYLWMEHTVDFSTVFPVIKFTLIQKGSTTIPVIPM